MAGLTRLLRRPEAALFALVFTAYAYFYQAGGWNQNSRFDLVRSLVERGTVRIDAYHRNTGDKARRDGHYYCDKAPGQSWLAVPAYAAYCAAAGGERPTPRMLSAGSYLVTVFSVALPSAIAVVMLSLLLAAMGLGPPARAALALTYGLGSLAFPYSTLFYGHQLVAALLLIAFALLARERLRETGDGRSPSPLLLAGVGLLLGGAVAVEYPAALAALPVGLYAASFVRPWPRLLWLAAGVAVPGIAVAAYHWVAFGGLLALPYDFSTQHHRSVGWMGLGVPRGAAMWGITFSSYRGLFYSAPWLVAGVVGVGLLVRSPRLRPEGLVCGAVAALFFWLNASLVDWQGGWAMGPRYLVPAIPFLAVGVAGMAQWGRLAAPRWWRRMATGVYGVAALLAAALMLVGTAVKPETPVYVKAPFQEYLLPRFFRGELAVSTQSIDSIGERAGGPRAAWNLGELLGLDGLTSLLPLALGAVACLAWLIWSVRSDRSVGVSS